MRKTRTASCCSLNLLLRQCGNSTRLFFKMTKTFSENRVRKNAASRYEHDCNHTQHAFAHSKNFPKMEKEKNAPNSPQEPTLEGVVTSFEDYLDEVTQAICQASPDGEARILAENTSSTLLSQMKKVHGYILESHEKLSSTQKDTFQTFLRVQDGLVMAQQGIETAKKVFKAGGFGKRFLKWLSKWFEEIKKIIQAIVDFICQIFGWTSPPWLPDLLVLLDEIINLLLSIFGESLGLDARALEKELSAMEVDYLNELAALQRLKQARRPRFLNDDEA